MLLVIRTIADGAWKIFTMSYSATARWERDGQIVRMWDNGFCTIRWVGDAEIKEIVAV